MIDPMKYPIGRHMCEHTTLHPTNKYQDFLSELYINIVYANLDILHGLLTSPAKTIPSEKSQYFQKLLEDLFSQTSTMNPQQIWWSKKPFDINMFIPIKNYYPHVQGKPLGGLWTSSPLLESRISGWEPLLQSGYIPNKEQYKSYIMNVNVQAVKIFQISSTQNWLYLLEQFPLISGSHIGVDWETAAQYIDIIHMTPKGIFTTSYVPITYKGKTFTAKGWDVECALWLQSPTTIGATIKDQYNVITE